MRLRKDIVVLVLLTIFISSGCGSRENNDADIVASSYLEDTKVSNVIEDVVIDNKLDEKDRNAMLDNTEIIDSIVVRQPFAPRQTQTYKSDTEIFKEIIALLKELDGEYMSNSKGMAFETVYIGLMNDDEEVGNVWFEPKFEFYGSSYDVNTEGYRNYYFIDEVLVEKWGELYQKLGFLENQGQPEYENNANK